MLGARRWRGEGFQGATDTAPEAAPERGGRLQGSGHSGSQMRFLTLDGGPEALHPDPEGFWHDSNNSSNKAQEPRARAYFPNETTNVHLTTGIPPTSLPGVLLMQRQMALFIYSVIQQVFLVFLSDPSMNTDRSLSL